MISFNGELPKKEHEQTKFAEGIKICDNDVHPEKVEYPIYVTEEGIIICSNDEHPLNAPSLIAITEEGIDISVNDSQ